MQITTCLSAPDTTPPPHMSASVSQSETGPESVSLQVWDTHRSADSPVHSSPLTLALSDQTGQHSAARSLMRGSTCHLRWITSTKSPESPPPAGWPGRTSWSPGWSAACWWETEPWGRPVWWSATRLMDTQQSTDRPASMSSLVSVWSQTLQGHFRQWMLWGFAMLGSVWFNSVCYGLNEMLLEIFNAFFKLIRCCCESFVWECWTSCHWLTL